MSILRHSYAAFAIFVIALVISLPSDAKPFAKRVFDELCAVCHGAGGQGDGPMSGQLLKRPTNLTLLTKRNSGTYPFDRIYQTIDGRNAVAAHGPRQMPIWGDVFRADGIPAASYPGMTLEEAVFLRSVGLVYYIQNMQVHND